jgi:hypothetical protein
LGGSLATLIKSAAGGHQSGYGKAAMNRMITLHCYGMDEDNIPDELRRYLDR